MMGFPSNLSVRVVGHSPTVRTLAATAVRPHGLMAHTLLSGHRNNYWSASATARSVSSLKDATQRSRFAHTDARAAEEERAPPTQGSTGSDREFWRSVSQFHDVEEKDFLRYRWTIKNLLESRDQGRNLTTIKSFLEANLPEEVPLDPLGKTFQSRLDFIEDVLSGVPSVNMMVRITPYILSRINWSDPRHDPIFRQFVPLKSNLLPDHPKLTMDSLGEEHDYVVHGLVHRYPDKALFLANSVCPVYCQYCTRARAVGGPTEKVCKNATKPQLKRWDDMLEYIRNQPDLHDIVISGGDSYYLLPDHIEYIGNALISMPNIRRFRFATKGLCVAPERILDESDPWFPAIVGVNNKAKKAGKMMAIHTHFSHANEISWITEEATQKFLDAGVLVRNQTVLLRNINDNLAAMSSLTRRLADINIIPYYVYQCDMVAGIEHLRTPLQTILDLEAQIRGSIAGFMTPQFVVDLPGGGGKRLAASHETYDRNTGRSTFRAPAVVGRGDEKKGRLYEYWDPTDTLHKEG